MGASEEGRGSGGGGGERFAAERGAAQVDVGGETERLRRRRCSAVAGQGSEEGERGQEASERPVDCSRPRQRPANVMHPESPLELLARCVLPQRLNDQVRTSNGIHWILETLYAKKTEPIVGMVYRVLCKHILPLQTGAHRLGQIVQNAQMGLPLLQSYARQFPPAPGEVRLEVENFCDHRSSDDPCTLKVGMPGGWVFGCAALATSEQSNTSDELGGWTAVLASEDGGLRVVNTNTGRCSDKIKSHNGAVSCIASIPTQGRGVLVVSGGDDGSVRIWTACQDQPGMLQGPQAVLYPLGKVKKVVSRPELTTGTVANHRVWVKAAGAVTAVAACRVGDHVEVVAGLNCGEIKAYKCRAPPGDPVCEQPPEASVCKQPPWEMDDTAPKWKAHCQRVVALEIFVDGANVTVFSASADLRGLVRCWTLADGAAGHIWDVWHGARVNDLTVSGVRREVCVVGDDGHALIWSVDQDDNSDRIREPLCRFEHTRQLICCAYDRSSDLIAAGGENGKLCVWNRATQTSAGTYQCHAHCIFDLAWLPCGGVFTTSGDDLVKKLSDVDQKTQPRMVGPEPADQLLLSHPCGVLGVCSSRTLAAWGGAGGRVKVGQFRVQAEGNMWCKHCIFNKSDDGSVYACAFSSDDVFLALVCWTGILPDGCGSLAVCDVSRGGKKVAYDRWNEGLVGVAFFPKDPNLLAVASMTNQVVLVKLSGGMIHRLSNLNFGHTKPVRSVCFSPSGVLASASEDHTVGIWELNFVRGGALAGDAVSGAVMRHRLEGHTQFVRHCAWSPRADLEMLASCGADKTVRVWDVEQKRQLVILRAHASITWAVSFSSDGRLLASCDNQGLVLLTEVDTWREVGCHDAQCGTRAVAFWGPERLVVGRADGDVTVLKLRRPHVDSSNLNHHDATVAIPAALAFSAT
eukprot:2379363-Rhodomonas_salina.2